jgi:FAD/FMN-containing dehydrogenase
MDVVVQPSVPWMSLNDEIKDSGLFFPVDPGPSVSALAMLPNKAASPIRRLVLVLINMLGSNRRHGRNQLQVSVYPDYDPRTWTNTRQWDKCCSVWDYERLGH